MQKEKYIEQRILQLTQYWGGLVLPVGAAIVIALSGLDFLVTPDNFQKFLYYRLTSAFVLMILFFLNLLNKKKLNKTLQLTIFILGTITVSVMVELMVLNTGGHQSIYYAGMIIVAILTLGFVPFSTLTKSLFFALLIYMIYLIPILAIDHISNQRIFINNNIFLIAISFISLLWRYYNDKLLVQNISLEYDLSKDKEQLQKYSQNLEDLVAERTKDLNKSEQWHRSLFENATDGIVVLDKNGIIVNANEKACEMHGFTREALVGVNIRLLEEDIDKEKITDRMRRLLTGETLVYEARHNKKDGTAIDLEISAKAITIGNESFIQSYYRDITEKKKLQEHLFQSQKMDSIGVLAGGIAHDFNNILTAILGHIEIIRKNPVLDVKAANSLSVIEDASRRAGRMISKLLGFARKSKYELVPLNLNDVVYDTIKLLERVIDKQIEMRVELDNHLPFIQADTNHIEQIVMNLIINARDAMPKGGKIIINTSVLDVKFNMPEVPQYIIPGQYVVLTISDTGIGMAESVRDKIFEPFFTTKERGKGTGLGLSMVYGAVKEHKGYITVASEVGVGSSFTIYLPAFTQSLATMPVVEATTSLRGDETLLLVDDEDDLLKFVQEALENHGYKTFAMNDSIDALAVFGKIPQEIALVITDIAMPNMDGKELIKKIKEIKPEIKILAMSGHTKYIADKDGIREIDGFLKKPFESHYMLSVVRRILDAKTRTSLTI
jgi:PAS domain S-box-containing protein